MYTGVCVCVCVCMHVYVYVCCMSGRHVILTPMHVWDAHARVQPKRTTGFANLFNGIMLASVQCPVGARCACKAIPRSGR